MELNANDNPNANHNMKRLLLSVLLFFAAQLSTFNFQLSTGIGSAHAQGWPSNYGGVMLQGFYWNSYAETKWTNLESQTDELAGSFDLIWVPQSGWCGSTNNMGYTPKYYWNQRSAFGTEAELRSMIKTFKDRGTGMIADVVVNHRESISGWYTFPAETYNGVTYQMTSADVCANDDGGKTATQAAKEGVSLSSNNDTGEDWDGCRDLDHNSENVQKIIKAYTKYLIDDLGYSGFRYDMVKGFYASFIATYNNYAKPQFSVGEYWDSNNAIKNWISYTKGDGSTPTSAAFDFQFRYNVRDAINNSDWTKLKSDNRLIADNYYKPYAVTFVENHDMEYRSASEQQDPIKKDTIQANAFLLAMPGTPCVFLPHWLAYKNEIKSLIEARKLAGVTNTSSYTTKASTTNYYAAEVTGSNVNLYVVVGKAGSVSSSTPFVSTSDYQEILSGYGYRYLVAKKDGFNHAWLDKASGEYDGEISVRCIALTTNSAAKLVYTTDGSEPTVSSTSIASGNSLHLTQSCTLKLGLVIDGKVVDTVTKTYEIAEFTPHTATIYCRVFNTLKSSWPTMNYYLWTGSSTELNGNWPGKQITETVEIGGQTWYKQTVDITSASYSVNAVFSTGTGSPQTIDVTGIKDDAFFVIKNSVLEDGKYDVTDVTSSYQQYVGVEGVTYDADAEQKLAIFDLQGRRVQHTLPGHVYIRGGKKFLAR